MATSLFEYVSSRKEISSDNALMHNLTNNVENLSDCLSPLFHVTAAVGDDRNGMDIIWGTLSLSIEGLCGKERGCSEPSGSCT